MDLILMRHGQALSVGEGDITRDADRPLSDEGRKVTRAVANALVALGIEPAVILTSPLARAAQTAAVAAERWGNPAIHTCHALACGGSAAAVVDAMSRHTAPCLAAVGHMPDLAELASYLIAGTTNAGLVFRKSGIALIRFEGTARAGAGSLEWLAPPRLLMGKR